MRPLRVLRALLPLIVPSLIITAAYMGDVRYYKSHYPAGDPDRYFHYSISKMTSEHGLVGELPQVEDLGWDRYFSDKAFLFHVFGAVGLRLGGESGAEFVGYIFGLGSFLVLLFESMRLAGVWRSVLLVLSLGLLNPYFSPRMTLFRAHVPAVFFSAYF